MSSIKSYLTQFSKEALLPALAAAEYYCNGTMHTSLIAAAIPIALDVWNDPAFDKNQLKKIASLVDKQTEAGLSSWTDEIKEGLTRKERRWLISTVRDALRDSHYLIYKYSQREKFDKEVFQLALEDPNFHDMVMEMLDSPNVTLFDDPTNHVMMTAIKTGHIGILRRLVQRGFKVKEGHLLHSAKMFNPKMAYPLLALGTEFPQALPKSIEDEIKSQLRESIVKIKLLILLAHKTGKHLFSTLPIDMFREIFKYISFSSLPIPESAKSVRET